MPWKETDAVEQRIEFVKRALRDEMPFAALCREFGIAPKTGYKWKQRFESDGTFGLLELSRRPHAFPAKLDEDFCCEIFRLKTQHPHWGPDKIRDIYQRAHPRLPLPSLSSVQRILTKSGQVKKRKPRRPAKDGGRLVNRFVPTAPNQVWSADFKGHWYSCRGEKVLPLTVCDGYSRFVLLIELVPDGSAATVRACFERLFEQYGLPLVIRSDNGSPFASSNAPLGLSRLSVWWLSLGISLDRIRPGHPEENGRHERMHRDIAMEVEGRVDGDLSAQQAALDAWREEYNGERPHAGVGLRLPAELYTPSARRYDPSLQSMEYPFEYLQRRVRGDGRIKIHNRVIMLSTALTGWDIGLQPLDDDRFNVWFGSLRLGALSVKDEKFAADSEMTYTVPGGRTGSIIQDKPLPMSPA